MPPPRASTSKNRANPAHLSQVRVLRERAGWTVIQLAVYADVAKGTVERLEAAERERDLETLERTQVSTYRALAAALEVPVRKLCPWLAGVEG